jgi:AAA domain
MNAREADFTEDEQAAFDNVITTFGRENVTVGDSRPSGPDNPSPKPRVLQDADEVLEEDAEPPSSWQAVDLRAVMRSRDGEDAPAILIRGDGQALLYTGKRNEIHGPYESGKSWVAAIGAAEVIRTGGVVVWIDFEDSARSIASRFLALGLAEDEVVVGLRYLQPVEPLTRATEIDLRLVLLGSSLVVIDAANEAMAAAGWDPNVNRDIAAWYRTIPQLATQAGATVLVLDHVAKDPANQRGSVGGGHKLAAIDGVSYRIDAVSPFGRGSTGLLRMKLAKDRPGYLRGALGSGREPAAAEVSIDAANPDALVVEIRPPTGAAGPFRPTHLMESVSRLIEGAEEPPSRRRIEEDVPGKATYIRQALDILVTDGYVSHENGPHGAILHRSIRPYREDS